MQAHERGEGHGEPEHPARIGEGVEGHADGTAEKAREKRVREASTDKKHSTGVRGINVVRRPSPAFRVQVQTGGKSHVREFSIKRLGAERMEAAGQPFDPNLHHAIEMVKTAAAPDHTILQVYQSGYSFKGKLLRPAIVKVAVEPDSNGDEVN